jgi:hypothetical protein
MSETLVQPGRRIHKADNDREQTSWYGWLTAPSVVGSVASIGDIFGVRTWHRPEGISPEMQAEALRGDLTRLGQDAWKAIAEVVAEEPEIRGQQTLFDVNVFSRRPTTRRAFTFWPRFRL